MPTTRAKSKAPINYEKQLSMEVADISKKISAPSGDRVRYTNMGFATPDGMEGEELEVVILDFMSSNLFYDAPYDRDNPQPPACFAIGQEPQLLVPSPNSPVVQSDTCSACPNNQFGSSGKGKACKNTRLVAVTPAAALASDWDGDIPIWIMSIPPTSLKPFDAFIKNLATKHQRPPVGVLTSIKRDTSVSFAAPRFNVIRPLDNTELGVVMPLRGEAVERLTTEPDVSTYAGNQPTAPKRRASRR